MSKPIAEHEGNKYVRTIVDCRAGSGVDFVNDHGTLQVDVYSVIDAFNVTCPARQHALKKLLCAGIRGKGDELDDLLGRTRPCPGPSTCSGRGGRSARRNRL